MRAKRYMKTTEAEPAPAGGRSPVHRALKAVFLGLLVVGWLVAAGAGLRWMLAAEMTPKRTARAAPAWPADSDLRPAPSGASLLLFAHPHCPCAPAVLDELAWLLRQGAGLSARVVFVRPPGAPAEWEQTATWRRAAALPGVEVRADEGGREARRFGTTASGEVLVYTGGRLVFQGGLIGARGHHGGHAGARAVLARLAGGDRVVETPVFGCPLVEREEEREGGGAGWR